MDTPGGNELTGLLGRDHRLRRQVEVRVELRDRGRHREREDRRHRDRRWGCIRGSRTQWSAGDQRNQSDPDSQAHDDP